MTVADYNPDTEIPSLDGKVIFITGGTGGIGRETIIQLAKHSPSHIFFTGRNETAAKAIIARTSTPGTSLTFIQCDPASLDSVRSAAKLFSSRATRLDIFIGNLGIISEEACTTKDGYEVHLGVNHLSHAAFLGAFLPLMLETAAAHNADVRYIAVTSQGAMLHPRQGVHLSSARDPEAFRWALPLGGGWARYGQSKLANILFSRELSKRYPSLLNVAVHPGCVETGFVKGLTWRSRMVTRLSQVSKGGLIQPHEGAYSTLWAATSPDVPRRVKEESEAAWFEPVGLVAKGDALCHDDKLASELWEWTAKELKVIL